MEKQKLNELVMMMTRTGKMIYNTLDKILEGGYVTEESASKIIDKIKNNEVEIDAFVSLYIHNVGMRLESMYRDYDGEPSKEDLREDEYLANSILRNTIQLMLDKPTPVSKMDTKEIAKIYMEEKKQPPFMPSSLESLVDADTVEEFIDKARELYENSSVGKFSFDKVIRSIGPSRLFEKLLILILSANREMHYFSVGILGTGNTVKDYVPKKLRRAFINNSDKMKELTIAAAMTGSEIVVKELDGSVDFQKYLDILENKYNGIDAPIRKELAKKIMNRTPHTFELCRTCINSITEKDAQKALDTINETGKLAPFILDILEDSTRDKFSDLFFGPSIEEVK